MVPASNRREYAPKGFSRVSTFTNPIAWSFAFATWLIVSHHKLRLGPAAWRDTLYIAHSIKTDLGCETRKASEVARKQAALVLKYLACHRGWYKLPAKGNTASVSGRLLARLLVPAPVPFSRRPTRFGPGVQRGSTHRLWRTILLCASQRYQDSQSGR
jgi:hypothetical protein